MKFGTKVVDLLRKSSITPPTMPRERRENDVIDERGEKLN